VTCAADDVMMYYSKFSNMIDFCLKIRNDEVIFLLLVELCMMFKHTC